MEMMHMSIESNIAVITGCFSLLVAMLSMGYSHITRLRVLKVEQSAKQDEHIRAKALTGIEDISYAMGHIGVLANSMATAVTHNFFDSPKELIAHFDPMLHDYRKLLGEAHHRYVVYLTPEISKEIMAIEKKLERIDLNLEKLNLMASEIWDAIEKIRTLTHQKYLALAGKIEND